MRVGDCGGGNSLTGAESPPIAHPTPMSESGLNSVRVVVCSTLVVVPTLAAALTARTGRLVEAPSGPGSLLCPLRRGHRGFPEEVWSTGPSG